MASVEVGRGALVDEVGATMPAGDTEVVVVVAGPAPLATVVEVAGGSVVRNAVSGGDVVVVVVVGPAARRRVLSWCRTLNTVVTASTTTNALSTPAAARADAGQSDRNRLIPTPQLSAPQYSPSGPPPHPHPGKPARSSLLEV